MISLITNILCLITVITIAILYNKQTKKYKELEKKLNQLEDSWILFNDDNTIIQNNIWLLSVAMQTATKQCEITKKTIYIKNITDTKCYIIYYDTADKNIKMTNGPTTIALTPKIN